MNIAQTGYTLPGLVLALGLLAPLLAIDNAMNALAGWLGSSLPGLILIGSGAAVVIAYVIRFLAVPTGFIKAGFERIPRDYDDSARAAGAGQSTTMRLIHLPLLRPAMLGAVIVVFVDCLKELPATLLLRPLNVETLATSIYQYASRGSFEEGALAALLIVAASIGPVAWLTRFSDVPAGPALRLVTPSFRGDAKHRTRKLELFAGSGPSDHPGMTTRCEAYANEKNLTRSSAPPEIRLRSSPSPHPA